MDANGRQLYRVISGKSFILLASQKFASLNSFAGNMPNVAGLRAEIAFINKDLTAGSTNHAHRAGGSKKKGIRILKRA